ncbi:MAG: hypothetical protein J0L47_08870 [Flavobacteriales bacterium]|nr:hypothetical protein [Flavobacteriales bacterium]MCA0390181.1 hypothetical protein [Bacteroidota bacterium]
MADKEKRFLEIEKRLEAQAKLNPELVRLTKLTAERGKEILKEYEAEFNKVLDGYKDYCRVNGLVIPKDTNEFFSWIALRYPDENLPFIIEVAKNPYNYKLFHDYKERLFTKPNWDSNKEREYLQTEIAEPQQTEIFSVPEWATIFYYADSANLLSGNNTDSIQKKLDCFIETHNITRSKSSLKNEYYIIKNKINVELNYPIEKLNKILPFMNEHYKQSIGLINNDITYLEENRSD